jgi:hypothetical protein
MQEQPLRQAVPPKDLQQQKAAAAGVALHTVHCHQEYGFFRLQA